VLKNDKRDSPFKEGMRSQRGGRSEVNQPVEIRRNKLHRHANPRLRRREERVIFGLKRRRKVLSFYSEPIGKKKVPSVENMVIRESRGGNGMRGIRGRGKHGKQREKKSGRGDRKKKKSHGAGKNKRNVKL